MSATAVLKKPIEAPTVESQVRDALKRVTTIATLPEVTAQIIKTVEDRKSTAAQLHKIISHDPALVSRILKVVNSAFYGFSGQVASIERAIVMLGLNAVKNIAVAASLGQLFRGIKLCEPFDAKDLWTHCIAVAVTGRELAKASKLPIADEAFLAGMIHDIGLLAQLQLSPEKLQKVCQETLDNQSFCESETRIIGLNHQDLGRGLSEQWQFPRNCQEAAGFHHCPAKSSRDTHALVTLIYVADSLCGQLEKGFNLTARGQQISDEHLANIPMDRAIMEATFVRLPSLIESAKSVFS